MAASISRAAALVNYSEYEFAGLSRRALKDGAEFASDEKPGLIVGGGW